MKHLRWLIPVGIVVVILTIFAVANSSRVVVNFWPLPFALQWPLCYILLMALAVGFLVGWSMEWIANLGLRRESRRRAKRIEALERDLAAAESRLKAAGTGGLLPGS